MYEIAQIRARQFDTNTIILTIAHSKFILVQSPVNKILFFLRLLGGIRKVKDFTVIQATDRPRNHLLTQFWSQQGMDIFRVTGLLQVHSDSKLSEAVVFSSSQANPTPPGHRHAATCAILEKRYPNPFHSGLGKSF